MIGRSFSKRFLGFSVLFLLVSAALFAVSFLDTYGVDSDKDIYHNLHINNSTSLIANLSDIPKSLVFYVVSALVLTIFLSVFLWMTEKIEQAIVVPFSTNNASGLDGKVISDMIAAELQRIKRIHNKSKESFSNRSERCFIIPEPANLIKELSITTKYISDSLGSVEKLSLGGFELPIGRILMVLNQYRPISKDGCIIHGSLQKYGSHIYIESHIIRQKETPITCEIKQKLNGDDISEVVRNLSFKIAYELIKNNEEPNNGSRVKVTENNHHNLIYQFRRMLAFFSDPRTRPHNEITNSVLDKNNPKNIDLVDTSLGKILGLEIDDVREDIKKLEQNFEMKSKKCPSRERGKYFFSIDDINVNSELDKELIKLLNLDVRQLDPDGIVKELNKLVKTDFNDNLETFRKTDLIKKINEVIFRKTNLNKTIKKFEDNNSDLIKLCEKTKCYRLNRLLLDEVFSSELRRPDHIKSWEILKYFTETLNCYTRYMVTKTREDLDKAYETCKNTPKVENTIIYNLLYNIGTHYIDLGVNDKAKEMFQKAVNTKPTMANAYCGLGEHAQ